MKRMLFFAILFASVVIINNLLHSIYGLWQKQSLIDQAHRELVSVKKENSRLKEEFARAQSQQFLEGEARNKLFLAKPGEHSVVLSSELLQASLAAQQNVVDRQPHWQQWWRLFF